MGLDAVWWLRYHQFAMSGWARHFLFSGIPALCVLLPVFGCGTNKVTPNVEAYRAGVFIFSVYKRPQGYWWQDANAGYDAGQKGTITVQGMDMSAQGGTCAPCQATCTTDGVDLLFPVQSSTPQAMHLRRDGIVLHLTDETDTVLYSIQSQPPVALILDPAGATVASAYPDATTPGYFYVSNSDNAGLGTVGGDLATPEIAALAFLPPLGKDSRAAIVTASILAWSP